MAKIAAVLLLSTGLVMPESRPVHITGQVFVQGCAVTGIGITDDVGLVVTDGAGAFELASHTARGRIRVVGPAGEALRFTESVSIRANRLGTMHVRIQLSAAR